ncbi:MAG TPA: 50S ribosomal protein L3 [Ktedonobacterales bacterium]|jgi:large subunit ribosomal protein L3|nr:50S ribosomal protein L3 [Ktedonobacterales bacterium]
MLSGLLGRKVGMTQVFGPNGAVIPVTVIEAGPCVVTQVRTMAKDGYEAAQIGFGDKKVARETRPMLGHLGHTLPATERQRQQQQREGAKARQEARRKAAEKTESADNETAADEAESAGATGKGRQGSRRRRGASDAMGPFQLLREVKVVGGDQPEVGEVVKVDMFSEGEQVDLIGTSKGKGFAGVMKRHGFRGGPRTHGQSDRARRPGSIGPGTTPGRVYKGTRMAGRMGNERVTVKALEIVQADPERNLLVIKGSVPGPNGGIVLIRKSADQMALAARSAANAAQQRA